MGGKSSSGTSAKSKLGLTKQRTQTIAPAIFRQENKEGGTPWSEGVALAQWKHDWAENANKAKRAGDEGWADKAKGEIWQEFEKNLAKMNIVVDSHPTMPEQEKKAALETVYAGRKEALERLDKMAQVEATGQPAPLSTGNNVVSQSDAEWEETYKAISQARRSAQLPESELPEAVQAMVRRQPVSEALYRLVDQGQRSEAEIEQTLKTGLSRIRADVKSKEAWDVTKEEAFDLDVLATRFDERREAHKLDKEAYAKLTKAEKAMVVFYTSYGDEVMNGHLQDLASAMETLATISDPKEREKHIAAMSEFLARPEAKENSMMAQTLMNALAKMPKFGGVVYRGTGEKYGQKLQEGKVVYNGGFMSTTRNEARKGFWDKKTQLALQTRRMGVEIGPFSQFKRENEVLVFPGVLNQVDLRTESYGGGIDIQPSEDKTFVGMREMDSPQRAVKPRPGDKRPGDGKAPITDYKGPLKKLSREEILEIAKIRKEPVSKVESDLAFQRGLAPYEKDFEQMIERAVQAAEKAEAARAGK